MRAILTPDDMKKGDLVDSAWYPSEISDYEEKPAGTDQSTNCIFHFKIIDGPNKGRGGNKLFNEKALGFGKNLWKLIVPGFNDKEGGELTSEVFKAAVGKKLKVYFKRGKSNKGNEFNDPTDFMPMS